MRKSLPKCLDCGKILTGHSIPKKCASCAQKGNKNNLGKYRTEETKQKMSESHKGNKNWNYKGKTLRNGYVAVYLPQHPYASKQNYVLEHRLVMEKYIGRYLRPEEEVHHKGIKYPINDIRNRSDNRIENLQLFKNTGEHTTFHNVRRNNENTNIALCRTIFSV